MDTGLRTLCFSLILIGIAVWYDIHKSYDENLITGISSSWKKHILKPTNVPSRVVIGVNANLDMIVSACELLIALNATPTEPADHPVLKSVVQLEQLVSFSMQKCAGVERTFSDPDLFDIITKISASLPHSYYIGGNAALMAERFKSESPSTQVVLIGIIGPKLRGLLNHDIVTPDFNESTKEEVHMILEYSSEDEWGKLKSFCANRVIFSHDVSNSRMVALEHLEVAVNRVNSDLVVLSGAHLLEANSKEFWVKRLRDAATTLESISAPVHWELATVGNMEFCLHFAQAIFPRVESLGLNEQELLFIAQSYKAPFDFSAIPSKPGIDYVADLLQWLMLTFSSKSKKSSVLTRVHLHTLSFHVIAAVEGGPWTNSKDAVMAGAQTAGLQACNVNTLHSTLFKVLLPKEFHISATDIKLSKNLLTAADGWTEWSRDGIRYYLSPVLVCKNPFKTVGLGDAISTSGLLYSHFSKFGK